MAKSTEIRGSKKAERIGKLAGWLIRVVGASLRVNFVDHSGVSDRQRTQTPVLYALWHNRVFVMPYAKRKYFHHRNAVVLTSASKDGAILANAVGVSGIGAVRGSSSRRAVAALVALRKAVKAGQDVCITPDGPRGPVYQVQPGIIKMAESTGAPVVVVRVHYHAFWQLKSWDRFKIPKPFSRVDVTLESPVFVPQKLTAEEFEQQRQALEKAMQNGLEDI